MPARPGASPHGSGTSTTTGLLDLYVSAYTAGIEHLAASALGRSAATETSRLYRGTNRGRFLDVSGRYGLTEPTAAMGSNFGDLDNDGYPDFYLGTGYPPYHSVMPNVMYRNRNGRGFSDVTYAGGFGHLQKGHGVVFADLDNDGDQDIFQQMGGAFPGDRFGNALYENPGFGNHWITIALEGVRSNRSAIGARIRAVVVDEQSGRRRSIYRHVNSGGSFGGNPLRQTLGTGPGFAHRTAGDPLARHRHHAGVRRCPGGSDHPHRRGRAVLFDPPPAPAHVRRITVTTDGRAHRGAFLDPDTVVVPPRQHSFPSTPPPPQ